MNVQINLKFHCFKLSFTRILFSADTKYLSMMNVGPNKITKEDDNSNVRVIRFKGFHKEAYDVRRGDLSHKTIDQIVSENKEKEKTKTVAESDE